MLVDRQRQRERDAQAHSETDRWVGIGSWKHLQKGNRQSGSVIDRRQTGKEVEDRARQLPKQRVGPDTPAQRDEGTEGVVEAEKKRGRERQIRAERPGDSSRTGAGIVARLFQADLRQTA